METLSWFGLVVLVLVVVNNWKKGHLADWFGAKFLNAADPPRAHTDAGAGVGGALAGAALSTGTSGYLRPVPGATISVFGDCRDGCRRRHEGNDLSATTGEPVHASRAGRVTFAGTSGNYGIWVELDHGGGWATRYAHLQRTAVRVGVNVAQGAVIGYADNTGNAAHTVTHVHFEIRHNGRAVDPAPYISGNTGAGHAAGGPLVPA